MILHSERRGERKSVNGFRRRILFRIIVIIIIRYNARDPSCVSIAVVKLPTQRAVR